MDSHLNNQDTLQFNQFYDNYANWNLPLNKAF